MKVFCSHSSRTARMNNKDLRLALVLASLGLASHFLLLLSVLESETFAGFIHFAGVMCTVISLVLNLNYWRES